MAVTLEVNRKRIQQADAHSGHRSALSEAELEPPSSRSRDLPIPARGVSIERPNHVWRTYITYIPMHGGFLYLVAVMDWFSRFVLSWELSNTMETGFLFGRAGGGIPLRPTRNLELRSRIPVHLARLSGAAEEARHLHQHGWTGVPGQRFHRAPVAQPEVRTHYPAILPAGRSVQALDRYFHSTITSVRTRRSLPHASRSVPAPVNRKRSSA